jgi:hypothetical protein
MGTKVKITKNNCKSAGISTAIQKIRGNACKTAVFFEHKVGDWRQVGKIYCTIAGIWPLPRIIEAKNCIIALFSFIVDYIVVTTQTIHVKSGGLGELVAETQTIRAKGFRQEPASSIFPHHHAHYASPDLGYDHPMRVR